ncbi:MAG: phage/plasmid primase, P4 family [Amphiplicatus sp.]
MIEGVDPYLAVRGARLVRWNGDFYSFVKGTYRVVEAEAIRAEVYSLTAANTKSKVDKFIDALKARVFADRDRLAPPCWLESVALDPSHLIVVRNGLLDLSTGKLWAHDDRFFSLTALPFDYDPNATAPRWTRFLAASWPNEPDCIDALQLIFGYLISSRTDLQVIPILTGPPRSGKGTIGRAMTELLGEGNWAAPTLDSLGENFGLQSLIGKRLALISDARIGKRSNKSAITETLLRVSGEDPLSVSRKFQPDWEGRLGAVIVIMGNEPPTFHDASSALIARYRVLAMRQTFVGREDRAVGRAISAEMPGVLNWAIEGWRKLNRVGEIVQPASAAEVVASMDRLANVVRAFVEDICVLDPAGTIDKADTYDRFKIWCDENGVRNSLSREWFGREILTAFGHRGVQSTKRPDGAGARVPISRGLRLRSFGEADTSSS